MAWIAKRGTGGGVRYDVCWRLPDATKRKRTFLRRRDADNYVKKLGGDELAGLVVDPNSGEVHFDEYAGRWVDTRLVKGRPLSASTAQGYRALLRRNLLPHFTGVPLRKFTPELVRSWHSTLATSTGQDQAAKSYRVLRAILNTAVDDTRIGRNPCRIRGGGSENAAERPMVTTRTVLEMADLARYRYRALILLAGLGGLRTGESLGLHRGDVDPLRRTVWIRQQAQEITGLGRIEGRPKSDAGKRAVVLPAAAMEALEAHMAAFTAADPASVVFTAPGGLPVRRAAVSEAWQEVKQLIGVDLDLRIHDLRHHAATMMARMPGVTTKELMARIGHASPRAALIYQHATEERDEAIADYMDQQVAASRSAESGGLVIPLHRH